MTPQARRPDRPRDRRSTPADFSAFYEQHAERVLAFLVRRCLDPELAVELMAETFAQALASHRGFPGKSAAEAGARLFWIARQQLYAYFDRGRVEHKALGRLGIEVPPVNGADIVRIEELAALSELLGVARERLDRLPAGPRAALQLRVIEQLPYAEVARFLAVSEDTARARVSHALRILSRPTAKRHQTRTQAMADSQRRSPGEVSVLVALGRELDRAVENRARPSRWGALPLRRPRASAGVLALTGLLLAAAAVGAASGWLPVDRVVRGGPPAPPDEIGGRAVATGSSPVAGSWRMEAYRSGASTHPEEGVVYEPSKLPCTRILLRDPPAATPVRVAGQCGHLARAPGFGYSSIRVLDGAGRGDHLIFGRAPKRAAMVRMTAPGGLRRLVDTRAGPKGASSDFWLIVAPPVHATATLRWRAADGSTTGEPLHVRATPRSLPPFARKTPRR